MGLLNDQVAIITGAGTGIGREAALMFAEEGARLVLAGRRIEPLNEVVQIIESNGGTAVARSTDLEDGDAAAALGAWTLGEFGRVDILMNNAAYARGADRTPILDLDPDIFQRVVDIKVTGTYLCTAAVLRPLIDQGEGGKIVNVSSSAGKRGSPNTLAYNAANFAIVGMTQSMARELGPHGINVNCVCPGAVDTFRMDDLERGARWEQMGRDTPIGRTGTDDEVGGLMVYLCTEAASWITGQSININGGTIMEH